MSASVQGTINEAKSSTDKHLSQPGEPGSADVPEKLEQSLTSQTPATTADEDASSGNRHQPTYVQQKWNEPRENMYRFLMTLFAFVVMGMNGGAVGVSQQHIGGLGGRLESS